MEYISKELGSMNWLEVWDVVDLEPKFKLVGTTWVFKVKKDHLGNITEHKAQLCAQGFTQSSGIDFGQTYLPTGQLNSLCSLIAFASSKSLELHQVDIKSPFLNAPLAETVYLAIPQGLNLDQRKHCLCLKRPFTDWSKHRLLAMKGCEPGSNPWVSCLVCWMRASSIEPGPIQSGCTFMSMTSPSSERM
ncbi:hypothetical protein O181_038513 [Austropuccinia psidii MF-1]|uniref:Reverse transcriptase Ty1/copia-type domain-containing protein n=1 Tax=Austropuccinia psidii MF-1 TaxID=1389203 RepID=A0A9Q3DBJ9_9BASI|nr:hypothetical protein [Austropuccinia psidii MF-1]